MGRGRRTDTGGKTTVTDRQSTLTLRQTTVTDVQTGAANHLYFIITSSFAASLLSFYVSFLKQNLAWAISLRLLWEDPRM